MEEIKKIGTSLEEVALTVAIDFDGVIHSYEDGYKDGSIYGTLVPGARECITKLKKKGYKIIIHTSRIVSFETGLVSPKRLDDVRDWLIKNEVPFDSIAPKVIAAVYIDDRAVRIDPNLSESLSWESGMKKIEEVLERRI